MSYYSSQYEDGNYLIKVTTTGKHEIYKKGSADWCFKADNKMSADIYIHNSKLQNTIFKKEIIIMNKIENLNQLITDLLDQKESLRDDDKKLIANVWAYQIGKSNLDDTITRRDFLLEFITELVTPNAIVTTRQNLQRDFVQFRGKKWNERHAKEIETRNEIREKIYAS